MKVNKRIRNVIALSIPLSAVLISACSTMNSVPHVSRSSPKYFTGTRLDIAAVMQDGDALAQFERYGMRPASIPVLDLPFSTALDVILFPYIVACDLQPFGPDFDCYPGP